MKNKHLLLLWGEDSTRKSTCKKLRRCAKLPVLKIS